MEIELIKSMLDSGELSKFINQNESAYFDAKSDNYKLDDPNGRYELAKDVSSFANALGGYIIIGLKTEHHEEEKVDYVSSMNLIKRDEFNNNKYEGIIDEYIYPNIQGIKIEWIEDDKQKGVGVGIIYVPKQEEDKKWYLISKVIEDNQDIKGIVFGMAKRNGQNSMPYSVEDVYRSIMTGKSSTSSRLTTIESKIDAILEKIPYQEGDQSDEIYMKRIDEVELL